MVHVRDAVMDGLIVFFLDPLSVVEDSEFDIVHILPQTNVNIVGATVSESVVHCFLSDSKELESEFPVFNFCLIRYELTGYRRKTINFT